MKRPRAHKNQLRNDHRSNWIKDNIKHRYTVLEYIEGPKEIDNPPRSFWETRQNITRLNDAEIWWIAYGRASEWPLTNLTNGGDGGTLGYHHTPEACERIGAPKRGKPRPDLVAYNTSRRGKPGRAQSEAEIEKRRQSLIRRGSTIGHPQTPETRAKISASKKGIKYRVQDDQVSIRINLLNPKAK